MLFRTANGLVYLLFSSDAVSRSLNHVYLFEILLIIGLKIGILFFKQKRQRQN
jgi:hypothetical protein